MSAPNAGGADDLAEAVERLERMHADARALAGIEIPVVRGNAARLVAITHELLGALDLEREPSHPTAWE